MPRLLAGFSGPLDQPGGKTLIGFGLIGRAPMSMLSVAFVAAAAAVDPETGYAFGGLAAGAMAVATAVVGPAIGRIADRRGQLPLARLLSVVATAAAALAVVSLLTIGVTPLYVLLAAMVGAMLPNTGAFTRARWAALDDPEGRLASAQALESINDELSFLIGPSAVAILATAWFAGLPIVVAMGLGLIGVWGITSRWSLPAPAPHPYGDGITGWRPRFPAGPGVLLPVACLGGALGAVQVLQLAYSAAIGVPEGAALVFFVNSGASLVGAILVGARTWRTPARRRFTISMVVYAAGLLPMALVGGYAPFLVAAALAGAAIAPTFIQSNAYVAEVTPGHSRTSSFSLLVSATALGIAAGAALAGSAVTVFGADAARLIVIPLGVLAAIAAIVTDVRGRWRTRALPA